ncbi:hypothetical protein V2A60_010289 [Cordyceps javanica]
MLLIRSLAVALPLASSALARTDLAGCTYTDLVVQATQMAAYASRLWYVPDTGEVCALLDCGGGRAPPKKTVPGCPQYTGTDTYAPSYVDPKTLGNGVIPAGSSVVLATAPVTHAAATSSSSSSSSGATTTTTPPTTATERGSIITLTGTNTPSSSSGGSSSAQVTSASSASSSSSGSSAAKTTSPSSAAAAAGPMQTVGAVLAPCVVAAIAAGLA